MITRLYANNFRCLVAFEAEFDSFGVLCGPNGGGKSSVFDAVRILRDLASGDITTEQAVGYQEHTNWLDSNVVELEVDMRVDSHAFMYRLHVEQVADSLKPRIVEERATCDRKLLFERDLHLGNLTSWFRFLSQEQEWSDHLRDALQRVWPDFRSFRLVSTGLQAKALQLRFERSGSKESGSLFIDQLSDGEKMLVGLYMIQSALATGAAETVLIDEPDNFVGLPELQPWITSLMELLGDGTQAIVISHHPEILNTAGEQFGRYLWRDNHTSPTRIGPLCPVEGLSIGEALARGWGNG